MTANTGVAIHTTRDWDPQPRGGGYRSTNGGPSVDCAPGEHFLYRKGVSLLLFAFGPAKSTANHDKHGIDFIEAQALWLDPNRVVLAANTKGEPRWLLIGRYAGRHWVAVFTVRGRTVRLISVRRARITEVARYDDLI